MGHHVGIDLIEIARIEELLEKKNQKFIDRVCLSSEQELVKKAKGVRTAQKLAAIFALKEAFSKAVGTGIGKELKLHDLEVTYRESGAPQIEYLGKGLKVTGDVACSVSHDRGMLVAIVSIDGKVQIRGTKK